MGLFGSLFGPGMMGMPAQPPPVPSVQQSLNNLQNVMQGQLPASSQQWHNYAQGGLGSAAAQQAPSDLLVTMNPITVSMNAKLLQLSTMLPMKLLAEILDVSLRENPMRIEVRFKEGKTFAIDDVDKFPSEEHAARIALECP